jgi:hypothetical protein
MHTRAHTHTRTRTRFSAGALDSSGPSSQSHQPRRVPKRDLRVLTKFSWSSGHFPPCSQGGGSILVRFKFQKKYTHTSVSASKTTWGKPSATCRCTTSFASDIISRGEMRCVTRQAGVQAWRASMVCKYGLQARCTMHERCRYAVRQEPWQA